ncbi:hypothetical protein POM88_029261 [Heracleum sosnowskyi]|uniref:4Fe-4S ferredoxin-type domain-containing protein n=1 Tax=Heracleum sosnowskyi TaxID=360622 RepID=A0AAD8MIB1_9APIA|nr:hypothetical protein POM88_029261 [Heracleum sosnowskyi]
MYVYGTDPQRGVLTERCYGCGRCFPVCPYDKIMEITYIRDAAATTELLKRSDVDAVEIHTSGRHISFFKELWDGLGDSVSCLKLVAVSKETFNRKKTQKKACFRLWTFPVIVDGPFGVVSAAEFIGILLFSVYIIWTVSFYIVHNVAAASSQPTFEEKRYNSMPC